MSRNARHAPTLFVGLGGSGVKVIRWLRQAIYTGMSEAEREREPVAFLGIDFDASSNRANGRLESLGATEFRFYDPASIAATVNNIDRERAVSQDAPPDGERWEFPEIREWYPDPDQTAIRYAQTEATGAAQWRPLGRVGYFLNDREIHDAIAEALAELDRRRGWSSTAGEHPNVVIVSSIAGGTGSSILFDVAVAMRKIGRGIAVRAFLLLPEMFAQIDFRDRVFPNAYATLWEVAALKNQHVVFHARYPRTPPVTRADSPPPFQRVFLVGPWIGERKPFSEPDDVYPFVAQMLRMSVTPEIRAAALSAEANASADSGAPLSDPTSLHVFCAMSAMAIRLLTYGELTDLVMRQFLAELKPEGERPLLDILSPGRTAAPMGEILDWIETAASGQDEAFAVTESYRSLELAKFIRERDSYRTLWRVSDLEKIRQDLRRFCGTDPAAPMDEPPGLMDRIRAEFAQRLEQRLQEWSAQNGDSPRALEGFLAQLERRLPETIQRKPLPDLQNIDNFEQWLDTGRTWGSLAQQLTPARLERLHDEARRWFNTQPRDADYRLWLRQTIENAARDVIGRLREAEKSRWIKVGTLRDAANSLLEVEVDPIEERNEQIYLDGRRTANAAEVLRRELARFDAAHVRAFHRALMAEFQSFYDDYRASEDTGAIQRWISATRRLFERQLATVGPGDVSTEATSYRLVSPESLFSDDEVTAAMLRCRNRVFQPGRVASPAALRIARLLVPQGFRDRGGYYTRMRNWAKGLLNAATSSLQANGSATENRIVIVIEDLFHPAEDIAGIYDYHAHYMQQDDRLLFHIHRQWPALFPPLITRAGDRTRVPCGNPGCTADIRLLSRTALFCPGCDQPIRNRCGNVHCLANDLADHPNREKFIESRTCPSCRGFLRTSWWKCPDHGDVPMDKPNCPYCVREGRPAVRISPRSDRLNRFTCPTCIARNILPPFTATGKLARYLIDGVDGHDLLDAQNEFRLRVNRDAFCPQCAAQLVPVCPLRDPDHPERPHYLYRHRERGKVDRFRCYLHPGAEFFRCGKCELPMQDGETRCHRCGEELRDCRFCTPLFGIRIPASVDADAPCPNCATRPKAQVELGDRRTLSAAEPDELFCANVFGCPAGGNLHDTTFPPHTKECPFCRSSELPLLRAFTREQHFRDCSFCREAFNQAGPVQGDATPKGECCLCGQAYADLASLIGIDLENARTIACVLRCTTDDERAFRLLLDRLAGQPLRCVFETFLARIRRDAVRRVVAARLDRILRLHDRQFGCRNDHPTRGGAGCDC
jgi:Tubulin like